MNYDDIQKMFSTMHDTIEELRVEVDTLKSHQQLNELEMMTLRKMLKAHESKVDFVHTL